MWLFWRQMPDGNLHVVFCDVGQGDAILVVYNNTQLLVDGGPGGEGVLKCLESHMPFWDRRIEVLVVTHGEKDHAGGLDDVAARYEVGVVVDNGVASGEENYRRLVAEAGEKMKILGKGDRVKAGPIEVEILGTIKAAENGEEINLNSGSLVGMLAFGKLKVLLAGDIGEQEELALVKEGVIKGADVLKVAHHGSKFSSSEAFLEAVSPRLAVISVGKDNRFGHPAAETLRRIDMVRASLKRTDIDGEVEVISDGDKWWLKRRL